MYLRSTTLFVFLISAILVRAQSEADWWYFGINAGIHFPNSVNPVSNSLGQLSTFEGCSSISDNQGNLLFYTDGSTIYDQNHTVMPNGTGLSGNASSTQSGVIVPSPSNPNIYYVFTLWNTLSYSVVDMSLNSGNGAVVTGQKNILLLNGTTEKLTATKNATNNGYWIVTHTFNNASFHAFELTGAGVNTTAVVSTVGTVHSQSIGSMKISPDGSRLAIANYVNSGTGELFDFDNSTGIVSNPILLPGPWATNFPYGVEFSPNSQVLYIHTAGGGGAISQFDITLGSAAAVNASKFVVFQQTGVFGSALQLGPDGKIYSGHFSGNALSVIHDPNTLGAGCNFTFGTVPITGTCRLGLPAFIQSFFNTDFSYEFTCFGDSTHFTIDTAGIDSAFWNFGDPGSGSSNDTSGLEAWHVFSDTGTFTVTLYAYQDSIVDSQLHQVFIYPQPVLDLGNDTALCVGDSITLVVDQPFATFLWHDGSTDSALTVTQDSVVSVTVYGECDTLTDTILVDFFYPFDLSLGPDTSICSYDSLLLDPGLPSGLTFLWDDNSTDSTLLTTASGTYSVTVTDSGACSYADTISISYLPALQLDLGPDEKFCYETQVPIVPVTQNATTYSWSTGETTPTIAVDSTDTFMLTVTDGFCELSDTVFYDLIFYPTADLGPDTSFCIDEAVPLSANLGNPFVSYQWNTGEASAQINASIQGLYWVQVSDSNCTIRDSVQIGEYPELTVSLGDDRHVCEGDTVELQVSSSGNITGFEWNTGSQSPSLIVTENSSFEVTVTDGLCFAETDAQVYFYKIPVVDLGADTAACYGDTLKFDIRSQLPLAAYEWHDGSNVFDQRFEIKEPVTFWAEITNEVCVGSDTITIGLRPQPNVDLGSGDTIICPDDMISLQARDTNLTVFNWSNGDTTTSISVSDSGVYRLAAGDGFCTSGDSIVVAIAPPPVIEFDAPAYYCIGDFIMLDASSPEFYHYRWQDGSTQSAYVVDSAGTYSVSADHLCGTTTETVTLDRCECQVWAPKAFHPDGDGLNDEFFLKFDCQLSRYHLWIYDRWGQLIFESRDAEESWNGFKDKTPAPVGSYAWKLEYRGIEKGAQVQEEASGVFMLIR